MINEKLEIETDKARMLLIDKPKDFSSARVVNIIKKKLNIKKAGHSGTLDPKASGLMIVCTDKMTKLLSRLIETDKEYRGIMILGETTPSFDSETEVNCRRPLNKINEFMVHEIADNFIGESEQIPPMYSAVKHKGKPLYKYARKQKLVERIPRKILIKEFVLENIDFPLVHFRIVCSKGTYVRSIVNDFGEKLGTGAYLKELRRTKIGSYDIKDSITLDDFLNQNFSNN